MKLKYIVSLFLFQIFWAEFTSAQSSTLETVYNEMQQRESEMLTVDSALLIPHTQVKRIRIKNVSECSKLKNKINGFPNLIEVEANSIELKLFPEFLREASQIEILVLSHNSISEIPIWISELKNLKHIDFSDNLLATLPESFFNLKNLQKINLEGNKLTIINESFTKFKKLRELNLKNNLITTIPHSLADTKALERIELWDNFISKEEAGNLRSIFHNISIRVGEQKSNTLNK